MTVVVMVVELTKRVFMGVIMVRWLAVVSV